MLKNLTRREFIKTAAMGLLAFNAFGVLPDEKAFAAGECTVKTRYGTFNGFMDENGVKTWLGIPYAKPPVGKLRWQASQPLKPSDKSFDAKKYGTAPYQAAMKIGKLVEGSKDPQSEDCLTLNIWKHGDGKNKPVMVWIYGGAFLSGSSSEAGYNGSNFAVAQDVIIVTLNYRLNIFGFMNFAGIDASFGDSGYLGMKDQIAALAWIKENIAEFGGNPDNVTVFGESAGSISTMLLTVIPAAKGLFQKVIPQSGHVGFYNKPDYSARVAEKFMKFSGAKKMSDLMKKSAAELQNIYTEFTKNNNVSNVAELFPTCDGKFLPCDPLQALKDGAAREIKFLTGTTADEWRAFMMFDENFFEMYRNEPEPISPAFKQHRKYNPEKVYQAWLENRPDTEDTYGDFATQVDWRVGQELSAEYQARFNDVYFYLFSERVDDTYRAFHGIDLPFTFNNPDPTLPPLSPEFVRQVQASWAAFAATGSPDNEFIPHWEKYSAGSRNTMELNSKGCVCHRDLNTENLKELRYVYES